MGRKAASLQDTQGYVGLIRDGREAAVKRVRERKWTGNRQKTLQPVPSSRHTGIYTHDLSDDVGINRQSRTLVVQVNIILHTFCVFLSCESHTVPYTLFTNVFCTNVVELHSLL